MSEKLVKVTEIVGVHSVGHEWDGIDATVAGGPVDLYEVGALLPDGVHGRGVFKITVEFTSEEA